MSTPKSVTDMAAKAGAKMVDIKFVDTFGTWQHFSMPIGELSVESFAEGLGFDGSSIRAKRKEHDALRLRPHPYEFFLYYDV